MGCGRPSRLRPGGRAPIAELAIQELRLGSLLAIAFHMTRILIVYGSHFGQTRKIAEVLARRLRERGYSVQLADAADLNVPAPEAYDVVVIGSRVETGRHSSEVRRYITRHLDELREIPTAFFSVSTAASQANAGWDPSGYIEALFSETDWRAARAAALAGALPYRKYNWFLRFIMKRIARSAGHPTDTSRDHELTDWAKVDAFADEIAELAPADVSSVSKL